MDYYALFTILQAHPLYRGQRDVFHQHILASQKEGEICWDELRRRWLDAFPDFIHHLESQREVFRNLRDENRERQKQGWRFVVLGEKNYPPDFYLMPDPPLKISYRGEPCWLNSSCVSVVGSREPREETLIWLERELSLFLETQEVCVVSGGARGVDQKAHALSVRKHRPTAVILPSGLGEMYPQSLQDWIRPVLDGGGCFLSEYDHWQKMQKYLFHHRNRLIAALGKIILIAEARKRSGTLITAQQGAQWGRPVLVVPGHPLDNHFAGSLDLLCEGAMLVRDAQDLDMIFESEKNTLHGLDVAVDESNIINHYP